MKLMLIHGKTQSAIIVDNTIIEYGRKIHKYESESDYKTITTELNTYGIKAALAVVDYLATTRA